LRSHVAQSDEDDVAQKFLDWLDIDVKDIFNKYFKKRMIYGEKEEMEYNAVTYVAKVGLIMKLRACRKLGTTVI